ncbi:Rv0340 family IniB-related protein [Mycolicibacterium pulveris]|uniref:Rv0340 family IniB-related protein n=1 Tax=Mycolicibacterium pulveris TaxID=36813 RepID=UPI003CEF6B72
MANSLLDFVMSVVRDPDIAARFAADPDQVLADANLTNVTSADVHALIPVVSESMSTLVTAPATAELDGLGEAATNVWASGAATAAFDAFGDEVPVSVIDDAPALITEHAGTAEPEPQFELDVPEVGVIDDDLAPAEAPVDDPLGDAVVDVMDVDPEPSGFDIF